MIWQVRLLAWLHIAIGGLGLVLGTVLCASLALTSTPESTEAFAYIGGFFGFMAVPVLVPALVGGIGLLRRHPGGRILILILSVFYLLLFPLGTVLGIFSLWTLLSPEGRHCFRRDETTGDQPPRSTISGKRRSMTQSDPVPAWRQHRDKRIAELGADPIKQKYIPLVERGEAWSDDQIAYNEAPDMTVTCPHLQPIERDLRRTEITIRRASSISVSAKCRIDEAAVRQRYNLAPPAYYVEDYQGDRSAQDYPVAYFNCRDCHSSISVLHPDQVRADTPTFPSSG